MFDLTDLIFEKYLDGTVDTDKFLELMEAVDDAEYVDAEFVGIDTQKKNKQEKDNTIDHITTKVALTAMANVANKKTHEQMIEKYKETKKLYTKNIKDAIAYIKSKKFDKAKECIRNARKEIEECERIIRNSDDGFLAWLSQHVAGDFKDAWLGILSGCITTIITNDSFKGVEMRDRVIEIKKLIDIINMVKYNRDAKGLGNALNKQRANMLATLNFAKKILDKVEKKIPRK